MKLYTLCKCVAMTLGTYSTKWCLSLKKMYSFWLFPHCLSVASEAPLRTRKGCMQLITSQDKKDHDGETNDYTAWHGLFCFHCCCCCSNPCFKTVDPSSLFFLTVIVTSLGPSPQSSTPCQQTFPCCTVCLVWLALGAREIPYAPGPILVYSQAGCCTGASLRPPQVFPLPGCAAHRKIRLGPRQVLHTSLF